MNAFWSDIESRFLKLHSEQRSANGLVHAINCDDSWKLGGPKDLQEKFRSIIRNIAVRLGWANDKDLLSVWCELLKEYGVGYQKMTGSIDRRRVELDTEQMCSIEREQRDTQGGTIDLLCKASAEYCIECDTKEAAAANATAVGPAAPFNSDSLQEALSPKAKKGRDFIQVREELKRIKHKCRQGGLSLREIRTQNPDFRVWTFAESLSKEDRETFERPGTWEAGYAVNVFLAKYYDSSPATMKKWVSAYREETGQKLPSKN